MAPAKPTKATRDLRKAVVAGDVPALMDALAKGADINHKDKSGAPALLDAVTRGFTDIVQLLLHNGADPNLHLWGLPGNTILKWAIRLGQPASAVLLLRGGADPSDPWVLKAAAECKMGSVVDTLISRGADVNGVSSDGTALMAAAYCGNLSMVQFLLDHDADPNIATANGWRALMTAAATGHAEVVDILLKAGADRRAQDKDGDTALSLAQREGHSSVVDLLSRATAA